MDSRPNVDSRAYAYAYPYRHPNTNPYADFNPNPDVYPHAHSHTYAYANCHSYANLDTHSLLRSQTSATYFQRQDHHPDGRLRSLAAATDEAGPIHVRASGRGSSPAIPNIRVVNLTPNVVERNFVWNAAPDGLTLAVEASLGVGHLADPNAQFDPRGSTMIGVTSGAEGRVVDTRDAPVRLHRRLLRSDSTRAHDRSRRFDS